ncbi:MAG TPA: HD domain-containing phosphohydrolase [Candidatus Omnitrophota bacterium]|nr:HD domain-containing phosphohydrolase [Candidatus Omnitrophota bacterium]
MRISDILKKSNQPREEKSAQGIPRDIPLKEESPRGAPDKETEAFFVSRISSVMDRVVSEEETVRLYDEALSLVGQVIREDADYRGIEALKLADTVARISQQIAFGNELLLLLAFTRNSIQTNYLLCHSLNVCIYALRIGLGLNYEKKQLLELGVSAFLHDLGMAKYLDLANQPRRLSDEEFKQIKNHPALGAQALADLKDFGKSAAEVCRQHHERCDGSGYPGGLKGEALSDYAKIVGIADVYEAMTHKRAYRQKFLSLETVQVILDAKDRFDGRLIKLLIDRVGIFPVGSLVKISSRETAQVIKINIGVPLRPVVRIVRDAEGRKPPSEKIFDLSAHPTVYVKGEERLVDT